MSRGRQLLITPDPRADASLYRLYVEGMMLAAALAQRGQFVLHASSVSVGPDAIAFLGPVGAGKSTFAAALCSQGRMLLADDNTAVAIEGGTPVVTPAFPSVKVYPKIAQSLGAEPRSLRPMHVSQVKEAQPVAAFSVERRKLRCLYVLDRAAQSGPARLTPVETVTELIRNSVPTRWGLKGDGRHLATCALLARKVPAFRVRTFRELSEIPGIAGAIERHAVCAGI